MSERTSADAVRPRGSAPELSVVVPTFQRPDLVSALLARLAAQTLAPKRFEVIVVDDGSEPRVAIDAATPFDCALLRQTNAGPAAARNLALERCTAPVCLILNDDAVPAANLLERHLAVHAEEERAGRGPVAVLGTFRFAPRAVAASPFVELLDRSDLLFDFSTLRDRGLHSWTAFWTCNVSVATRELRDAGGFDPANFRDIVEDVELGLRLERRGVRVLHRADLVAHHDHVWTREAYFPRSVRLGAALARLYAKHREPLALRLPAGARPDAEFVRRMQATCESLHPALPKVEALLAKIEVEYRGRALPDALVTQLASTVARVNAVPLYRGMLAELTGADPGPVLDHGPARGRLTSAIVVSYDALESTRACIETLRRNAEPDHPLELVVVDNGSRDGSREWLESQRDVRLVANETNAGAPAARNQALAIARGEHVVFLDNDVLVTPGWLGRMLFHLEVDARCACVGPLTDRAAHGQQLDYAGADAGLDAFASARAASHARQFRHASLLSSFCLLAKRSTIERLGGFDTAFSPWGFEDDDYTLRAALGGRHNRVALDVFVRHKAYRSGAKAERHARLLADNWARFRSKWGLPADAPRGDYRALEGLLASEGPDARIHHPPSAVPAAPTTTERVRTCAT